jgi:hypothetical protein
MNKYFCNDFDNLILKNFHKNMKGLEKKRRHATIKAPQIAMHLRSVGRRSCFSDSWPLLAKEITFLQKLLVYNNRDVQQGAIFNHVLKIYLYQIPDRICRIPDRK